MRGFLGLIRGIHRKNKKIKETLSEKISNQPRRGVSIKAHPKGPFYAQDTVNEE